MSITVVKHGLSDSIQDGGRHGVAALGINPSGAMDLLAMKTANALLGNDLNEAVIEMCFPAASFRFEEDALIALSGASFVASLLWNHEPIVFEVNKTAWVKAGTELYFNWKETGQYGYLAVQGGFKLEPWLGSYSTQLSVGKAGFEGRRLRKGDKLPFRKKLKSSFDKPKVFPWRASVYSWYQDAGIFNVITGNEWPWMEQASQKDFLFKHFKVLAQADRMGYRLEGPVLQKTAGMELLSSAVTFGTIQLLPSGQLIVLMADHPTTGGYPRIAHVISAHLPKLAQTNPGTEIRFAKTSIENAEKLYRLQLLELKQLQMAVKLQLGTVI